MRQDLDIPGSGVTGSFELPFMGQDSKSGPLQEQNRLSAAESSLQPILTLYDVISKDLMSCLEVLFDGLKN